MIFLDTSAIYALADRGDPNHGQALAGFRRMLEDGEEVLVHSYVLVESAALLQRRLGLDTAMQFLQESQQFRVHWIGAPEHGEAMDLLQDRGKRGLSLVDCTSFVIMRQYQVDQALAFDSDFETEGFELYQASQS